MNSWVSLLFLVSITLGFGAGASSHFQPVYGEYEFKGEVLPLQVIQNERVQTDSAKGLQRMNALKAQGFICAGGSAYVYHCSRYINLNVLPGVVEQRIRYRAEGFKLKIIPSNYPPILSLHADNYFEWYVPAFVTWGEESYDFYRLHLIEGDYKVSFGDHGDFNYVSLSYKQGNFFALVQEILNEGSQRWTQFIVQVKLEPAHKAFSTASFTLF